MIESVFLEIAGFNFKLNFLPSDNLFLRQTFIMDFNKYFSGFKVEKPKGKIDFTIDLREAVNIEMIYNKRQNTYYSEVVKLKGSNKASTLYRIGFLQFSFLLKQLLLRMIRKKNAFMLHTSSVNIGGRAYLFMAHSGGGKSTTMKFLSKTYSSLGDDSAIIKKEGGKYYYYQTPMVEKEYWIKKGSRRYEIGGLYFINKAKVFEEKDFDSKKDALIKIMDQLLISDQDNRDTVKLLLAFIRNFSQFKLLYFPKDDKNLLQYFSNKHGKR